jgi:hypothetical protein
MITVLYCFFSKWLLVAGDVPAQKVMVSCTGGFRFQEKSRSTGESFSTCIGLPFFFLTTVSFFGFLRMLLRGSLLPLLNINTSMYRHFDSKINDKVALSFPKVGRHFKNLPIPTHPFEENRGGRHRQNKKKQRTVGQGKIFSACLPQQLLTGPPPKYEYCGNIQLSYSVLGGLLLE